MRKVYDKRSPLTLPNGRTLTPEDMAAEDAYRCLVELDMVIEVDSAGVMSSMSRLAPMKDAHGIEESDPVKAFELVRQAEARDAELLEQAQAEETATIEDLQAQLDELAGAFEELVGLTLGEEA